MVRIKPALSVLKSAVLARLVKENMTAIVESRMRAGEEEEEMTVGRGRTSRQKRPAPPLIVSLELPKWCTAKLGLLPGRHDAWP
jgi:hypothetical protein